MSDLASRMYPSTVTAQPAAGMPGASTPGGPQNAAHAVTEPSAAAVSDSGTLGPASTPPAPSIDLQVDELLGRELSMGDKLYADGGQLFTSADAARASMDGHFQPLGVDADEADRQALRDGQRVVSELLIEMAVPKSEAREIASVLGDAHSRLTQTGEATPEAIESSRDAAEEALRKEWGQEYDARVVLARRAYRQAVAKAPWLEGLVANTTAGNNAALIRHFAEIGLRNGRKARRQS